MSKEQEETKKIPQRLSDDTLDGVAALILMGITITGIVFWLNSMPY